MNRDAASSLRHAFRALLGHYGPQGWWPAENDVEVIVGAVLVQNTAWANVEKAIASLREHDLLDLDRIAAIPERRLARLIRPAGTYRVKARRLLALVAMLRDNGGTRALAELPTGTLRERLLAVHGVGGETADAILCYAFHRPVFVVDAYARRLYSRLGWLAARAPATEYGRLTGNALGLDAGHLNEWHALLVAHAKSTCRPRPRCGACIIERDCPRRGVADHAS